MREEREGAWEKKNNLALNRFGSYQTTERHSMVLGYGAGEIFPGGQENLSLTKCPGTLQSTTSYNYRSRRVVLWHRGSSYAGGW